MDSGIVQSPDWSRGRDRCLSLELLASLRFELEGLKNPESLKSSTQRASRMRGERVSQSRTFSINLVTDSPFQKDGLGGEGESPSRTGVARERRALPRQTACGVWHRHERDAQCLNFLHKIDPAAAARDGDG
jgi:hypothetical protein